MGAPGIVAGVIDLPAESFPEHQAMVKRFDGSIALLMAKIFAARSLEWVQPIEDHRSA
jgi:hypothetical protein